MSRPQTLAAALDSAAVSCRDTEPSDWTAEDYDLILRSLNTVSYEVVGLAARIRAARAVNNAPVPHPLRPQPQPKTPPPPPPPPPPAKPGGK